MEDRQIIDAVPITNKAIDARLKSNNICTKANQKFKK